MKRVILALGVVFLRARGNTNPVVYITLPTASPRRRESRERYQPVRVGDIPISNLAVAVSRHSYSVLSNESVPKDTWNQSSNMLAAPPARRTMRGRRR